VQRRTGATGGSEDDQGGGGDAADLDAAAPGTLDVPSTTDPAAASRRRARRRLLGAAAGAALVLAVGLVAQQQARPTTAAGARSSGTAEAGSSAVPGVEADADRLFPVLADPASAGTGFLGDELPAELGVVEGSERLLAITPSAVFWVARDAGGVCLLVRDLGLTGGTSGRCASTAEVAARGLTLDAGDPGTPGAGGSTVSAVLLPAGLDALPLRARGHTEVASGLWLDGPSAAALVEAAVDGTATRVVVVPSEAHRGSSDLPEVATSAGAPYAVVVACLPPPEQRADVDVAVGRDGGRTRGALDPVDCRDGTVAHTFVGDGGPVRVRVRTPDDLVWAASVVACDGPLSRPTC